MISRFFIDRPIFATVLSVVITLAGALAIAPLPVTQYPEIAPPTVEVSTAYPGANAQVVVDTVAAPIEQQVNGVEGMMYMSSQSTNDGAYTLSITFEPGTDLNLAQVMVQNRMALAQPILPDLVKRRGVTVKKKSPSVLMIVNLFSPNGTRDNLYLSNYATIQLRDELSRVAGVSDISFLGRRDYSMRIWLDPQAMASRNVSSADVVTAIQQQNVQVAAGQIGQPPVPTGQAFQYTMTTQGRLENEREFGNMIVRAGDERRIIRLRDIAHTELGAQAYDQVCTLDGRPSVALSIYQLPGANALETAQQVRDKMEDLKSRFPQDVDYSIVYDTTPFIRESVNEVFVSLRDAVILVAIVVLVFLQGWRAAIIPLIAVPVAIIGTFACMLAAGFSINTLTLFGLVLAVGIVVDDAIVVVEAVEHHIQEGLSPRDAAILAMDQVAGPVIAVGLVLTAVFVPCAFITGIVGQFFRQFAMTIAISTVISAFNSLTLSPALAVLLLRPRTSTRGEALPRLAYLIAGVWAGARLLAPHIAPMVARWIALLPARVQPWWPWIFGALCGVVAYLLSPLMNIVLMFFFRVFNAAFNLVAAGYVRTVGVLLRASVVVLVVYAVLMGLTYKLFNETPTGFIPSHDKGYLVVNVRLPESASLSRTQQSMQQIEKLAGQTPGVRHTVAIAGQSLLLGAGAPNFGSMYVMLDEFHTRAKKKLSADVIAADLKQRLQEGVEEGEINILGAPPIEGLGAAGGFKIAIEDRGEMGPGALEKTGREIVEKGAASPILRDVFTSARANTNWLYLDVDRDAARTMGVSMTDVFNTLQVNFGSLYVNDFNRFGRTWQVNVQAEARYRMQSDDLKRIYVPTRTGQMAPFSSFMKVREVSGPVMLVRYNLYSAALVSADAAEGASSGEAIKTLEKITQQSLGSSMRQEWTELGFLQQRAGNRAMYAFLLAVVLVFLVLAAQYESWALPLAVILVVPMCLLCSVVGVIAAHLDINIFTQVGFVVLVGLGCKNAILIVEFARARHEAGMSRREATLAACRLRLRPIIMTSFAFIFGVVPLVLSTGAGAEMRHTLGVAVFAGMLGVTLFGIFLTPVFFFVIQYFSDWAEGEKPAPKTQQPTEPVTEAEMVPVAH